MRALAYFFSEAAGSLVRRPAASFVAIVTMAIGIFVLGFFLVVGTNVGHVLDRLSRSAELSVFLAPDATAEQVAAIETAIDGSGAAAGRQLVSKDEARARFAADFPDLAPTAAALEHNPFPASVEVRLRPDAGEAAVARLVESLGGAAGVSDVRYDRQLLERLDAIVRGGRIAAAIVIGILGIAAAMTVANVVRLAAAARRDEIEIMQLVGAPLTYVRGPFVAEGILQGGIGALIAIAALAGLFQLVRLNYGPAVAEVLGVETLTFLPVGVMTLLVVGGMAVGAVGSFLAARVVR